MSVARTKDHRVLKFNQNMKNLTELKNIEKDQKFGVDLIQKSDNKIINAVAQKVRAKV